MFKVLFPKCFKVIFHKCFKEFFLKCFKVIFPKYGSFIECHPSHYNLPYSSKWDQSIFFFCNWWCSSAGNLFKTCSQIQWIHLPAFWNPDKLTSCLFSENCPFIQLFWIKRNHWTELIFGATGGCVKFFPAVIFFPETSRSIVYLKRVDKFIGQRKDLCCLEANLMMS